MPITPTTTVNVRYMVADVEAAVAWYTKHLGFTVLSKPLLLSRMCRDRIALNHNRCAIPTGFILSRRLQERALGLRRGHRRGCRRERRLSSASNAA